MHGMVMAELQLTIEQVLEILVTKLERREEEFCTRSMRRQAIYRFIILR